MAGPGSSTSLSSCYTGASSSSNQTGVVVSDQRKRMSANLSTPPTIEGPLAHKQLVSQIGGGRKRSTDRNWKDYWAILHGSTLYLCRERPTARYRSETAITDETVSALFDTRLGEVFSKGSCEMVSGGGSFYILSHWGLFRLTLRHRLVDK